MCFVCVVTSVLDDDIDGGGAGYLSVVTKLQVDNGEQSFNSRYGQRFFSRIIQHAGRF